MNNASVGILETGRAAMATAEGQLIELAKYFGDALPLSTILLFCEEGQMGRQSGPRR